MEDKLENTSRRDMNKKILEICRDIKNIEYCPDKDFTQLNTLKLNVQADLILCETEKSLQTLIKKFNTNEITYKIIGWGSNILLSPGLEPYIQIAFSEEELGTENLEFELPANFYLPKLVKHASQYGFKGVEVLTGIPCTLGGAIAMNAGTRLGEISELVTEVKILNELGEIKYLRDKELKFKYRGNEFLKQRDIILSARLLTKGKDPNIRKVITDYLKKRNQTQPLKENTCGCVFKNPSNSNKSAGELIDEAGLKGKGVGNIYVSKIHANFFENSGQATLEDAKKLIITIQDAVEEKFGISLELEVKFL